MLKYLFKKNVKTDEGYKKYQLLWFPLTILVALVIFFVMYTQFGLSSEFYSGIVGGSIPLVIYFIWLVRLLSNPKRLKAARLRLTDERRKVVEQEVWAHIGQFMMVITIFFMLVSIFFDSIQLESYPFIIILYGMIIYRWARLRK